MDRMNITIVGAGNSGLAMAAHLTLAGHQVTLWNRTEKNISQLMKTKIIYAEGVVEGAAKIHQVTADEELAFSYPDLILLTTPANSHKNLAKMIALHLKKDALIVLNPGRTFGALEFKKLYQEYNQINEVTIAETQTIIYTCRKISDDRVDIISLKSDVLISTFDPSKNVELINQLPDVYKNHLIPAKSMIETSLGNVGMILHCAPLLLNTGWTESSKVNYKYYYDGISPTISRFIEKIDQERVAVSKALGLEVETTKDWLERTYRLKKGENLYDTIHKNSAYLTITAPESLNHRYILEDVPCGLVPLEAVGQALDLEMTATKLVIDLASTLMEIDFRETGRNLDFILKDQKQDTIKNLFKKETN